MKNLAVLSIIFCFTITGIVPVLGSISNLCADVPALMETQTTIIQAVGYSTLPIKMMASFLSGQITGVGSFADTATAKKSKQPPQSDSPQRTAAFSGGFEFLSPQRTLQASACNALTSFSYNLSTGYSGIEVRTSRRHDESALLHILLLLLFLAILPRGVSDCSVTHSRYTDISPTRI